MIYEPFLRCIISFLYIKPQRKPSGLMKRISCIISFLYIKPQHNALPYQICQSCIISFLYIKPQPVGLVSVSASGCIISFLYIKPQLERSPLFFASVVLYRFSTSNHNPKLVLWQQVTVVLYRFSTSNHNQFTDTSLREELYYIVSLHQTTTVGWVTTLSIGCIISFLYIKPQPSSWPKQYANVVLYRFSTSNHNLMEWNC